MASSNGRRPGELDAATAKAAVAVRLAHVVIGAFDACEQAGAPLAQLQKVVLLETALLEFDGIEAELESLAAFEELLHAVVRDKASGG